MWSCDWHWSGGLLATASMDHCCKLWDVERYGNSMCYNTLSLSEHSGQCFVTLRGHADSVNSVMWLPYSNTLTTCSSDKTVSLWDARTVSSYSPPVVHVTHVSLRDCVCRHSMDTTTHVMMSYQTTRYA